VAQACNPSYLGGRDQEIVVWSHPGQIVQEILSQKKKKKTQKRADGVAQMVENLPSKREFKPNTAKKKN
jgi:hypothetical protein